MVYTLALYVHLCALFAAFAASALTHFGEARMARARDGAEVAEWLRFVRGVAVTFPLAILVLVASGSYMVSAASISWESGWLVASLAGVGVLALSGPLVIGARMRRLGQALAAGDRAEALRLGGDPVMRCAAWGNTGLALGIAFLMVARPPLAVSVAVLAAGWLLGVAVARPLRKPEAATA
ncbi:DUF2269 family protein [Fulvimonas yonginensis]|uniref:DUF2269 family protein n=1 Tax=Fulvimonas yonginensis TaxID=1495200 RepID=A0ABU8JF48_9GAMM